MSMHPALEVFFNAGLRHIKQGKDIYGVDPCVRLEHADPGYQTWRLFLMKEFGRLPRVMKMHEAGQIPSITMPCADPNALLPMINVVRSEMENGELAPPPPPTRGEGKHRRSSR